MSKPILEVKNLTLRLKKSGLKVVDDVSFTVQSGETVALLGESGAGKSTLFKAILQVLRNQDWERKGEIHTQGIEITGKVPKELEAIRGPMVRCIFQEPALSLNPSLKVDRQLSEAILAVEPTLSEKEVKQRIATALVDGGIPPGLVSGKFPGDLSGGQRQRVGTAMSICVPAPLLLADEPSTSLDSVTVTELVKTLIRLQEAKHIGSLFIVTHDLGVLRALNCERVLFMDEGRIYEAGSITDVLSKPVHPKLAEMVSLMNVIENMEHKILETNSKEHHTPLFKIEDVDFSYKARTFFKKTKIPALKNISFEVGKNEFIALVGNSGSGKSTIGKLLTKELMDYEGKITFDSLDLRDYSKKLNRKHFFQNVQVIFQEPADTFDPSLTMRENLSESFLSMGKTKKEVEIIFSDLLSILLLDERMLGEPPRNLSGGQKQRFALMRAFGSHPSLILADEPFNNLDLISQQRLMEILLERKQHKEFPLSCVLISHDIGVVAKLCEKILVVDQGEIIEYGNFQTIVNNPKHDATKRLITAAKMLGSIN